MDIAFSSEKLRKRCSVEKEMKKEYGNLTRPLQLRLTELDAAACLADLPPHARCHPLTGTRAGQFGLKLSGNFRLIVVPDHDPLPRLADGGIDPNRITRIEVLEIVDYHGE